MGIINRIIRMHYEQPIIIIAYIGLLIGLTFAVQLIIDMIKEIT